MNKWLIFLLLASLYGCGTLKTATSTDQQLRDSLVKVDSHCETLPRAYSGLSYDLCVLNSRQRPDRSVIIDQNYLKLKFYGIDAVVSPIADTVLLPYTLVQQSKYGSIYL